MRGPFVSGNLFGRIELAHFLFERFDSALKFCDVLLLPEELFIESVDGFILQGKQGFKFYNSFFHGNQPSRLAGKLERFNRLLR